MAMILDRTHEGISMEKWEWELPPGKDWLYKIHGSGQHGKGGRKIFMSNEEVLIAAKNMIAAVTADMAQQRVQQQLKQQKAG